MKNQNFLIVVQLTLAFASVLCCIICMRRFKTWKTKANDYLVAAERLEREVNVLGCNLEASIEREGLYINKIAKLQKTNQPKLQIPHSAHKEQPSLKPNMTEKRHRVLVLARYGQDVDTIANTLGLPHGEVELIVNLNSVAS